MKWREVVQDRLLEMQPASVHALDAQASELVSRLLPDIAAPQHTESPSPVFTLALGIQALDGFNIQAARQLISHTRLYIAPRLLLVERADGILDADAFRALGFTLGAMDRAENLNVYEYDLDTYKPVPDWLNARYWAHPERWKP